MSRSAFWGSLLLILAMGLAACGRAPTVAPDPGVDLSDPEVGGGAGQDSGPQTPIPTATATREGSPRLEGATGGQLPTLTPPTPVATSLPATAPPAPTPNTLPPAEAAATPAPSATPAPPEAIAPTATATATLAGERVHVVQAGENLYRIGLQYGLSWLAIAEYNGITNPDAITVGQELRIPPSPTATATVEAGRPTTDDGRQTAAEEPPPGVVAEERPPMTDDRPQPVDAPAVVGGRESARPSSVVSPPTHTIAPGETLYAIGRRYGVDWSQIAEANGLATPNQLLPGQQLKIPPDVAGPAPAFNHRVHSGETLGRIAAQYGLPADTLAQANALAAPYVIYAGQVLVIPGE